MVNLTIFNVEEIKKINLCFYKKMFRNLDDKMIITCNFLKTKSYAILKKYLSRHSFLLKPEKANLRFSEQLFLRIPLYDSLNLFYLFKHQPHKMVKHTQTIRWQQLTNCFSVFDHFVGLALKRLFIDFIY